MNIILDIVFVLSWIVIITCFFASVSLCYRRGWLTGRIRVIELMLLTGKELEEILKSLKGKPENPEARKCLESWRDFSNCIMNTQEPDWKEVFRRPKKRKNN